VTETVQEPSVEAARAAYSRHAWREAYERFAEADKLGRLAPSDLELYAEASFWFSHFNESLSLLERAYAAHLEAGEKQAAGKMAIALADNNRTRRADAVAAAWLGRAERLLEGDPDSAPYGHLRLRRGLISRDLEVTLAESRAAQEIAERSGDPDLRALAVMHEGAALLRKGQIHEGMAKIDEATIAAVSGELSILTTGIVFCATISACREIADYGRASEWTDAALRWCERQSVGGFPGICRVHRAELLELRGALARAEQEARLAHDELVRWDIRTVIGDSVYEIGSIRLRMGDLAAAEEAFRQAYEMGRKPEPGLALLRLATGDAPGANAALRRVLSDERAQPSRARLLPAQVDIAIAAGDLTTASAAAAELDDIARSFGTDALAASAHHARGALALARGDFEVARHALQDALELWQKIDAPFEAGQTRLLIARCMRGAGDDGAARVEFAAAKAIFERIGARRDAQIAAAELGDQPGAPAVGDGTAVTRTFLFTDIVDSTKLVSAIGDEAWKDLIRWHDDTLRSVIAEHGGEEIRHQGDGLVVSFGQPARAIEAAILIQRRLAEHRKTHGFAPAVRIGVHRTAVTPRGLDYAGVGIHEAARVGALAGAGEILVSRATLEASGTEFVADGARTVDLKGIAEPVEVLSIGWR
jgi:class 3 adenylate cyclase